MLNFYMAFCLLFFFKQSCWSESKSPRHENTLSQMVASTEAFKQLAPIINKYCVNCHNADKQKGDFRIDNMDQDLVYGVHAQRWYEVLDILNLGEMPPRKSKQPDNEERRTLIGVLTAELEKAKIARKGQVKSLMRRLNKEQYNNTLKDLLGINYDFARDLPEDAISPEGFTNNGASLGVSALQMEYYLAIARKALSKAIVHGPPEVMKFRVDFGLSINPGKKERLIMGPGSKVIPGNHYSVSAPEPVRPYEYIHRRVKDSYVFNEGYAGNGTVRGEKVFKGLHHAVYPELERYNDKIIPEGMLLESRGDLLFGIPGQQGPSGHMKLVVRDFPQSGPVTIRVAASKGPNATFAKFVGKEAITKGTPVIDNIDSKAVYPEGSNLETPTFIITGELEVKETGLYQIDARLLSHSDGIYNLQIGHTEMQRARFDKNTKELVTPVAIAMLQKGRTFYKVTGKNKIELADFALTSLADDSTQAKVFKKQTHKTNHMAILYDDQPLAQYSEKENKYLNTSLHVTVGKARPINDWEYKIPKAVNYPLVHTFDIKHKGIYQVDFELSAKPQSGLDIQLNHAKLSNVVFNYLPTVKNYSVGLIQLKKGQHSINIDSVYDIPLKSISITPVTDAESLKVFHTHNASQYAYLRAFIGSRRDDGQEYDPLPEIIKIDAPLDKPQIIEFHCHIEDYPLPAYDKDNKNFLANLLHIGLWNTPWNNAKSSDVVIHSIEFETNVSPTWPPLSHKSIFIDSKKSNEAEYAKEVLANFLPKAFRRQITNDELDRHLNFYEKLRPFHTNFESAVKEVLSIALSSPQFLFINEPVGTASNKLTEDELANRLSYFLWNTMPDETLLKAAKNKTLMRDLDVHITRMIKDPKSFRFSKAFSTQWLDLNRIDRVIVNSRYSSLYQKDLKASFKKETHSFFHHVLTRNKSIMDFIDSDYAVVDWRLASFYGLEEHNTLDFKPLALGTESRRGGILTHGSLLTALSDGKHSSPIKRGVWLAKRIVDSPPPKPPPNVPPLDEENPELAKLSMKEKLQLHRDNPSCRDCHMKIDPWGIPFEDYNAIGQFKKRVNRDDTGTVFQDGSRVNGLDELKTYILNEKSELVARSLIKFLSTYASGRSLSFTDEDEIKRMVSEAQNSDYRLQEIIKIIIRSDIFLKF